MTTLFHPKLTAILEPSFFPQRCTIQANTPVDDTFGQPKDSWSDRPSLTALPCRVGGISGGERHASNQTYLDATHAILLSGNYPMIIETNRAVVNGQAYDILLPIPSPEGAVTKLIVRLVM